MRICSIDEYNRQHMESISRNAELIHAFFGQVPSTALVLGSGFQPIAEQFGIGDSLGWDSLGGIPLPTASGHQGGFREAEFAGQRVLLVLGRLHYYEGHPMSQVTLPVRVLAAAGVRQLILTNAAGAIRPEFRAGELMLLADHLNFMGTNPLRPESSGDNPNFVDLTEVYDSGMRNQFRAAAKTAGVLLREGVYLAVSGPTYETPAEIRAFRSWGADAVGMSTVPEAIVARSLGLRVAAFSCLTNPAAGLHDRPLSHLEVLENGKRSSRQAGRLLEEFFRLEPVRLKSG